MVFYKGAQHGGTSWFKDFVLVIIIRFYDLDKSEPEIEIKNVKDFPA